MAKPRSETTLLDRLIDDTSPTTLSDAAFDAAISGEGWPDILDAFRRGMAARAIALIEYDTQAKTAVIHQSLGIEPRFLGEYHRGQSAADIWMKRIDLSIGPADVVRGEDLVPESLLMGSEFLRDWLAPQGLFHCLLSVLLRRGKTRVICAAWKGEPDGSFADDAIEFLRREAPRLGRALKIHDIVSRIATEREAALAVLDQIPIGMIIVDHAGTVLESNRFANEILSHDDGLSVEHTGLKAHSRDTTVALHEMIARAVAGEGYATAAEADTLSLERPSGRPNLAATVCRLPLASRFLGSRRRAAAIYLTDPETRLDLDIEKLRQLYKLTPAEARLAALLAQGFRLEDAATELGVSLNTVRTHLKRIFSKTETDRQADLVRLVLSGPARIQLSQIV